MPVGVTAGQASRPHVPDGGHLASARALIDLGERTERASPPSPIARLGPRPPWAAESFDDLADDVRQSRARITGSPFVPHTDDVRGFVFDVATGALEEIH